MKCPRVSIWPFFLAFGLVFLAWPHLFFKGQVPVDGNVLRLLYPNRTFLIAHPPTLWRWPLWNPYRNMGEPFLADPVTMAAYPPVWVLSRIGSMVSFFRLWVLGHTLLAGGFMGLWVYRKTQDETAAFTAAVVAMFNGFFMARVTLAHHFASASYVPAALYFFDTEQSLFFGITLALQWLAGFPSFSYITASMAGLWCLIERKSKWAVFWQGGLLGLGLAAYQVIPFVELFYHSVRPLILDPAIALEYAEPWKQLLKMLFVPQWYAWHPQLWGDQAVVSFYVGPLVLATAGWAAWTGKRRERVILFLVTLCFLLSLGGRFPGYSSLPFLRVLRYPANWLLVSVTGLAFLCGMGIARFESRGVKWIVAGLIGIDLLGFSHYVRVPWFKPDYLTQPPQLISLLGSRSPASRIFHTPLVTAGLSELQLKGTEDYRFIKEALPPSYGMAFGLREVSSYQILGLSRAERFQRRLVAAGPDSPLLRWAGISTVITRRPGLGPWGPQNIQVLTIRDAKPAFLFYGDTAPTDKRIDVLGYGPGEIKGTVGSAKGNLIVFSEVSYPGWRATIDGQRASLELFQDTFLAVQVPPGLHEVVFVYWPWTFWSGLTVSLGLAVFLVFLRSKRITGLSLSTVL